MIYTAPQEHRTEQHSGEFICRDCGKTVHDWTGFYNFFGWQAATMRRQRWGTKICPPKRPRDPNQLAKRIIDIATGEKPEPDTDPKADKEDQSASEKLHVAQSKRHDISPGNRIGETMAPGAGWLRPA